MTSAVTPPVDVALAEISAKVVRHAGHMTDSSLAAAGRLLPVQVSHRPNLHTPETH